MQKYFSPPKIKQLVEKFSFSELRKLLGEMDIELFALYYFPKYFDRKFRKFHRESFTELKYKGLIEAFGLSREHGKSTINYFLFPLYSTLYNKSQITLIKKKGIQKLKEIERILRYRQDIIKDFDRELFTQIVE